MLSQSYAVLEQMGEHVYANTSVAILAQGAAIALLIISFVQAMAAHVSGYLEAHGAWEDGKEKIQELGIETIDDLRCMFLNGEEADSCGLRRQWLLVSLCGSSSHVRAIAAVKTTPLFSNRWRHSS